MKKYIIFMSFIMVFGCTPTDSTLEIEAIKKIIEQETFSFFKVNRPDWESSWVHEPYAYWSYSDSTGTNFMEGWDAINQTFDEYFKTQKASRNIDVAHPEDDLTIERDWKEFRIYGNGAFVQYTQRVKDKQINRDATSQIRILEKRDGKWLVAYVGIIARYPVE